MFPNLTEYKNLFSYQDLFVIGLAFLSAHLDPVCLSLGAIFESQT